jgi:hypothetical protein
MAKSFVLTQSVTVDGVAVASGSDTITADGLKQFDDSVAGSTTNKEIDIAFVLAALKSFFLYTSQALTIKTNSSGAPQETFTVPAGGVLAWSSNMSTALFAGNVTKIYATNAGSTAATLKICVGEDITP